jgi:hypothetical protein
MGYARIEINKQDELARIEARRQAAFQALNDKYAIADKTKKSFGYICIISLTLLYVIILPNDLFKLVSFCLSELIEMLAANENAKQNSDKDDDENDETLDVDYNRDLDDKLEKFHINLVKAVANSRRKQHIHKFDA